MTAIATAPPLRIVLGSRDVTIWSREIFGAETSRLRAFLARTFAVGEVEQVELRRDDAVGRIHYGPVPDPASIWKRLGRVFDPSSRDPAAPDASESPAPAIDAELVYLEGAASVRISRIGRALSSWNVHRQTRTTLNLSHPALRRRRDVAFRLEEELATVFGVEEFRANSVTGRVAIRFDAEQTTAERIARALERAWPRLLAGLEGPSSRKRLVAAVGLTGLAFAGQYVFLPVRPIAVAAVAIYSAPNVVAAAKQLRHGQVGLYALYSAGLGFMLVTGLPFTASVMATLMQAWPKLGRRTVVGTQRRLFAQLRRLPDQARRVAADGVEVQVDAEQLSAGDVVVVRAGEVVPIDGVVESGAAAVFPAASLGNGKAADALPGDFVAAGWLVRDGSLKIRGERPGADTAARHLASRLPHGLIPDLPSSHEAERVANRNARFALTGAALALLLTRTAPPSQGIIRPDYATPARLGAQLSSFQAIAEGFERGVSFRRAAAIDAIETCNRYVIDASSGIERRDIQVLSVRCVKAVAPDVVVGYALAGQRSAPTSQLEPLTSFATKRNVALVAARSTDRRAGVVRFHDDEGRLVEIATRAHLDASGIDVPSRFDTVIVRREVGEKLKGAAPEREGALQSLWVVRDGVVLGVVSFARTGDVIGRAVVQALRAHAPEARILYATRNDDDDVRSLARKLGLELVAGDSSRRPSGDPARILWIGDGSDPSLRGALAASTVSVSVAPLSRVRDDAADISLPHHGLSALGDLLALGRAHAARTSRDYQTLYWANLVGAGGAVLGTFTPLQVGLLSNVGTGFIYARYAFALNRLASRVQRRQAKLSNLARRGAASAA